MNFKITILSAFICLVSISSIAQDDTKWDKRVQTGPKLNKNWSFFLGINIIDDSANGLYIGDHWNVATPIAASVEYHISNAFGVSALFTNNNYNEGKKIDGNFIVKGHEATYMAGDIALKFYMRNWFRTPVLDPYVFAGGGYTNIGEYRVSSGNYNFVPGRDDLDENGHLIVPEIGRFTVNAGFGMNIWINNHWGIMGAATGKWGVASGDYEKGPNEISNQIQYTFGLLYLLKDK